MTGASIGAYMYAHECLCVLTNVYMYIYIFGIESYKSGYDCLMEGVQKCVHVFRSVSGVWILVYLYMDVSNHAFVYISISIKALLSLNIHVSI